MGWADDQPKTLLMFILSLTAGRRKWLGTDIDWFRDISQMKAARSSLTFEPGRQAKPSSFKHRGTYRIHLCGPYILYPQTSQHASHKFGQNKIAMLRRTNIDPRRPPPLFHPRATGPWNVGALRKPCRTKWQHSL